MSLQNQIEKELKEAMTQKKATEVSVLRMIISAVKNQMIADKKKELNDEEVMAVITNQAKRRKESIAAFEKGGRQDLADQEKAELEIIQAYLPEQLSAEEIKKAVDDIISKQGDNPNFGAVMGQVMAKLKGQADGKIVTQIVKDALA